VVSSSPDAPAAPQERVTLGCRCPQPTPEKPLSAVCGSCGLIFLTAEEYDAHLAASAKRIDAMLRRLEGGDDAAPDAAQVSEAATAVNGASRPGRWRARFRRG
jgi:hypothetical protein